jgi:hypothetical protein
LGRSFSRLWREGHTQGPQGVHRSYRVGSARSKLRKYTIGPYGRVTLHQARVAAQKVFAAKLEGRDLAGEKREAKRRIVTDQVADLLENLHCPTCVAEIEPILRKDPITRVRSGWLFEAARAFETFLDPQMRSPRASSDLIESDLGFPSEGKS